MGEKTESGKARQCLSLEVFHPFGYGSRIRRSTHRSSRRVKEQFIEGLRGVVERMKRTEITLRQAPGFE
ncbi:MULTISPECIES: hypothetical protein [Paenibacillus]|uniref:hypothetical protein n=1 Tax=Paenibacillus TaxID=44249 RepID=UPI0015D639D0|nr:hypothetical protein [Paenibacillus polymyxa]MEB4783892.1 hypothetical protein [Paenibacillus jamilae]MCJ1221928.1 hypothetical protein [Paenibacillus polymyxa]MDU8674369.1 hypothetical protein [Paenibacillus polymyxa]MDU8699277.1 hypothetical protein [Paenibacillus polymyxa]MEE4565009.1 hypothetical protein [Paenibacillus polymyxa]